MLRARFHDYLQLIQQCTEAKKNGPPQTCGFCHQPCAALGNEAGAQQTEPDQQSNGKLTLATAWSHNCEN